MMILRLGNLLPELDFFQLSSSHITWHRIKPLGTCNAIHFHFYRFEMISHNLSQPEEHESWPNVFWPLVYRLSMAPERGYLQVISSRSSSKKEKEMDCHQWHCISNAVITQYESLHKYFFLSFPLKNYLRWYISNLHAMFSPYNIRSNSCWTLSP